MTTREERQAHKESRRFSKLQRLVDRLEMRCSRSQRSVKIVDEVLEKCAKNGEFGRMVEAIRSEN